VRIFESGDIDESDSSYFEEAAAGLSSAGYFLDKLQEGGSLSQTVTNLDTPTPIVTAESMGDALTALDTAVEKLYDDLTDVSDNELQLEQDKKSLEQLSDLMVQLLDEFSSQKL
jgi:hypothetical protein